MKKLLVTSPLSQRDSRWKNILLGFNTATYTIGSDGCLLTSLCFYLNSIGVEITPDKLNSYWKDKDHVGFVNGGYFTWQQYSDTKITTKLAYRSTRYDGVATPSSFFDDMRKAIDAGHILFVEVDFNPSQVGEQMHWLAAIGYTDSKDFYVMDPWTGSVVLLSTYGELSNAVYSYTYYDKVVAEEKPTTTVDCTEIQKKYDKLLNDYTALNTKYGQLKGTLDAEEKSHTDEILRKNNTIDQLTTTNKVLQEQNLAQTNQIGSLTTQKDEVEAKLVNQEELQTKLKQATEDINTLNKRLEDGILGYKPSELLKAFFKVLVAKLANNVSPRDAVVSEQQSEELLPLLKDKEEGDTK